MIWHPFTAQLGADEPLEIVRGDGEYLYDAAGKPYIDAISSWWTMIHGHNHPQITAAISAQLGRLDHVMLGGFTHEPALQLAKRLLKISGNNFHKVFYSDNGSTAVEVMLKLALQYWHNLGQQQRTGFIRFDANYHGDTIGAMSVGGDSVFNQVFDPVMFRSQSFAYPTAGQQAEQVLQALDTYMGQHHKQVAGIILEPLIAAAGGMVFQDEDVLRNIGGLAAKYNVLLLFDEVFTGMGRTGEMFAFQKAGVVPDILALAKGLTGGVLPLAATLVSQKIHAAFVSEDPHKTFYHGHTMTGNPPGCAAALASLDLFGKKSRLKQVASLEQKMTSFWQNLVSRFPEKLTQPRCRGAVSAVNLISLSEKPGYVFSAVKSIKAQALAEGVILRPLGNVIYVTPPYNISDEALQKIFAVIYGIVERYQND